MRVVRGWGELRALRDAAVVSGLGQWIVHLSVQPAALDDVEHCQALQETSDCVRLRGTLGKLPIVATWHSWLLCCKASAGAGAVQAKCNEELPEVRRG